MSTSSSSYQKKPPMDVPNTNYIFVKKRKSCPFTAAGIRHIDYKDVNTLSRFITERGKIIPRRITGVSFHHQKLLVAAIKRARHMALLPFVSMD